MKEQSIDIPIHDIKPLVDIQEYSFYYFITLVLFFILLACGVVYLFYRWYKKRKVYDQRKEYKKLINSLDLKDTKKSAYALSNYGYIFKDDSPRHLEMFNNLTQRLEQYKYKKNVDAFDDETIAYIDLYKGMIDV
jgi:hypothetical protein